MQYTTVYHPTEVPFRGLYSKPSPVALGVGMYQTVTNWRIDDGVLRVRYPMTRDTSTAAVTGNWVGAWSGYLNGAHYRIGINYNSGAGTVNIYRWNATGTQTTISQSSGKYGDTRLSTSFKTCSMAPVKDPRTGREYLVIQDGASDPRVWDSLGSDSGDNRSLAVNAAITNPTTSPQLSNVVTFPKYFRIKDAANTSYSNSHGTRFTAADIGASSTANYITMAVQTGATSGDTSTWTLDTARDLSACPYLCILVNSAYTAFPENVKLELVDATGNTVIHDPKSTTSTTYKPYIPIPIGETGAWWMYVFSIAHVPSANRDAVTGIKWTFTGTAPSTNQTVLCYGVFGSGAVAGQATHKITFINQGSRAESPTTAFSPTDYVGEYFKNLGCSDSLTTKLPNDPRVYYQYNINFVNITTAQLQAGVDGMVVYRSDYGEDISIKTYVSTKTIGTYAASAWGFGTDSAGNTLTTGGLHVFYDNTAIESKDASILAPDAGCLTIPKGIWMESTPERLFVLTYDTTGTYNAPSHSAMWASDAYCFSRFYRFHIAEDSGTRVDLPGETATAMRSVPSSQFGVSTMLLWTNKSLYRFSATSASYINKLERIASYGTWTPYSIAASDNALYWVDQSRIVRRFDGGGVSDISSLAVQNKLDLVGGSAWAYAGVANAKLFFGGFWKEKYYLSFDQTGTINWSTGAESPLIFDTRHNVWLEDSLGSATYSTRFWLTSDSSLDVLSKNGYLYHYEDSNQTTDGYSYDGGIQGSGYTATLKTGSYFPGMKGDGAGLLVMYTDVMTDDFDSGTMSYTYNYLPSGGAPTQSASIDGSASVKWCTPSAVPSGNTQGGLAVSIQMVMSTGCAGKRLYGSRIRWDARDIRPSV